MTLAAFKRSLASKEPPLGLSPAVAALWWSGKDEWNKAHEIVMDRDDPDCAWVHAYLHLRAISAGTPFARTRRSRGGWTAIAATLLPDSAAERDSLNWPPVSLAMPPSTSPPNRSPMRTEIASIYAAAEIGSFPANGTPVHKRVKIGREGIVGDHQADRRVHGGPEKAIHHYAATNHPILAACFPDIAAAFVPGSIGENLSASGVDETRYRRYLCSRFGSPAGESTARPMLENRCALRRCRRRQIHSDFCCQGWYCRALEAGDAAVGDELILLERNPDPVFIAEFWTGGASARLARTSSPAL